MVLVHRYEDIMWEEKVSYSVSKSLHRLRHSYRRTLQCICCPGTSQLLPGCLGLEIFIMSPPYSQIFKVRMAASAAFYDCNVVRTYIRFPPLGAVTVSMSVSAQTGRSAR